MANEAASRSAGSPDRKGHSGAGESDSPPLQTRAPFIKNWDWQSVIRINRGTCERGRAQHGINTETGATCEAQWETKRQTTLTLQETIDFLKACHRQAPFLFFNGNTFAAIGRELTFVCSVICRQRGSVKSHRLSLITSQACCHLKIWSRSLTA